MSTKRTPLGEQIRQAHANLSKPEAAALDVATEFRKSIANLPFVRQKAMVDALGVAVPLLMQMEQSDATRVIQVLVELNARKP